jgi:predicted DNA-binding protein (MmcQ/YjbR family)
VDRDKAIAHCLSRPGAYLDHPWGPEMAVVKVGGKIFAFLGSPDGPLTITVKNTPELIDEWRARYPAHCGPGPYLSKTLWNRVDTAGPGAPDDDEVRELVDESYALIVAALPRSKRP